MGAFKKVASSIAKKEGVSMQEASAMEAGHNRKAVEHNPSLAKSNPDLMRIGGMREAYEKGIKAKHGESSCRAKVRHEAEHHAKLYEYSRS